MFFVPCCEVLYDFRINTKISSSLLQVVCRRVRVLLYFVYLIAYSGVQYFVLLCGFTFLFLCCDVLIKSMSSVSTPSVVCRSALISGFFLTHRGVLRINGQDGEFLTKRIYCLSFTSTWVHLRCFDEQLIHFLQNVYCTLRSPIQ